MRSKNSFLVGMFLAVAFAFSVVLTPSVAAQQLPKAIRGYKVHKEVLVVSSKTTKDPDSLISVEFDEPSLADISLTGVTLAMGAEMISREQSGKVDMLMFHDVKVNGIGVEIVEFSERFEFKKKEPFGLPQPVNIFLPTTGIVQAAWREMRESKDEWVVTGRVFVFGKFRKYGFHHKRVVPVDFEVTFPNPLRNSGDT